MNAGQLSLVCEWLGRVLDDFLRYLNAGQSEKFGTENGNNMTKRETRKISYPEFIAEITQGDVPKLQKQYFLETELPEYYFNKITQILLSMDLALCAFQELNSLVVVPVLTKLALVPPGLTGDPLFYQL